MLNIKTFQVNPLMVNCYVISDDTKEACIIDPGCMAETEWTAIKNYINDKGLKLVHMLCTHLPLQQVALRHAGVEVLGIADRAEHDVSVEEIGDLRIRVVDRTHSVAVPLPQDSHRLRQRRARKLVARCACARTSRG